jgi:nuclear cap-binding protein subunit 1
MREVVASASAPATTTAPQAEGEDTSMTSELEDAKKREAQAARELFRTTQDALVAWASGAKDELMEDAGGLSEAEREERDRAVRRWGERWLRVVRRRAAIEETFLLEAEKNTKA